MNLMVYALGLEASTMYFDVLHFYLNILRQFSPCLIFFATLTINTIRWHLWFRHLVIFRIIPWCEWYLMFPFPFSIPLVSSNHWGCHDIDNLLPFYLCGIVFFSSFYYGIALGLKISMGKQVSVALGLKINMGKQASSWQAKRNKSANITDWYKFI